MIYHQGPVTSKASIAVSLTTVAALRTFNNRTVFPVDPGFALG
jgi:hypothetical protein